MYLTHVKQDVLASLLVSCHVFYVYIQSIVLWIRTHNVSATFFPSYSNLNVSFLRHLSPFFWGKTIHIWGTCFHVCRHVLSINLKNSFSLDHHHGCSPCCWETCNTAVDVPLCINTLHMDTEWASGGLTSLLQTCSCCLFFCPLSSSSACGSIDKHPWLCNCAQWNAHFVNQMHIVSHHHRQHQTECTFTCI